MPDTEILGPDDRGLERAADLLRRGELVAFPTETVYGLGARADRGEAVARVFAAKGRPRFNPLIVHVPDLAAAQRIAELDAAAKALAEAFWPGPLTLVAPLRGDAGISPLVTAGLATVAVRVPGHAVARDLLERTGAGVAAPSANPSGRISPTRAEHVLAGLDGRIAAVLDAGPCPVGVESTIIATGAGEARLLRAGGLPTEEIERCLGRPLATAATAARRPEAPGQLTSHYAPAVPVRLGARQPERGELWLGFGPQAAGADFNLSPSGDLVEAAARLFEGMHLLDARAQAEGRRGIAVSPIPGHGLGRAINDRLRRAAAGR